MKAARSSTRSIRMKSPASGEAGLSKLKLGGRGAMIGGDQGQPPRLYDALHSKRFTGQPVYF
jgi:hypothetical protein